MPRKRKDSTQPIGMALLQSDFVVNNAQRILHTPEVEKILDKAMPLLRARKGAQAERLFRKAIALKPIQPDLLNNLASSLIAQERNDEATTIIEAIHILFPDYLFARTTLAITALRVGNFEQASEFLAPLFSQREFHISEYDALCSAVIEYCIYTRQYPDARVWLDVWAGPNPENPKMEF
ncbi:MAG: tetratricopeptide repeat protein [Chloroflexi bacterium]|nr:tetratricopeptide repeat protein [Chloroflexota bacterium]